MAIALVHRPIVLQIPVPVAWQQQYGMPSYVECVRQSDETGRRWTLIEATVPYCCSWCEEWRTGLYYSYPPIVACPDHFILP